MYTALFGGTFNPLHIGHYQMLSALENDKKIDEIFIMPDKIPPHKICDFIAEDKVRIEMCRIAAEDFSKARLCLVEFERDGKSYSYDTVKRLKEEYTDKKFIFVCGGDMLVTLDKWYRYKELIRLIPFYAFKRTDTDEKLFNKYVDTLSKEGAEIIVNNQPIKNVSSTAIRENFKKSRSLLPEKIYDYLIEGKVYK